MGCYTLLLLVHVLICTRQSMLWVLLLLVHVLICTRQSMLWVVTRFSYWYMYSYALDRVCCGLLHASPIGTCACVSAYALCRVCCRLLHASPIGTCTCGSAYALDRVYCWLTDSLFMYFSYTHKRVPLGSSWPALWCAGV